MVRVRTLAVLTVLTATLLAPASSVHAKRPPVRQMIVKINDFRAAHGKRRLTTSTSLNRSSRSYARRMMRSGYFGHSRRIHASGRFRFKGEVLEMHPGRYARPRVALRNWKRSGPHRSALLHRSFRYVGGGWVRGRYRGRMSVMWVVQLGRK